MLKNKDYKLNNNLSPWQIILRSGCLFESIASILAASLCLYVFLIVYAFEFWYTGTARFVGVIALLTTLVFAVLAIKETILLFKVICRKYKVVSSKILSIKPWDKYRVTNNHDSVFELIDLKVFVPYYKSGQFRVSDKITTVIVDKRRYPLVILKNNK